MMGTVVDMHVHTIVGSMDSDISPKRLGGQGQAGGGPGLALSEAPPPLRAVPATRRARALPNACDAYGPYFVICPPFRYFPGPSSLLFGHRRDQQSMPLEELAEHPVFSLADAIEVVNGGCIDRENRLALDVARRLGKPQTAGSDAHMPLEVGRYGTIFEKDLESEDDMLRELRAGRFGPGRRAR